MNSDVMPVGHLTQDQVRAVMTACAAAPALRNSRPWHLECTPTALELRADLPFADTSGGLSADDPANSSADRPADNSAQPDHRELLLACGAALLNVRATIKMLGIHPAVRLMPDENQPDLLALVHPQAGVAAAPADVALAAAIAQRRTFRPLTGGIPVPMINRLRQAARVERTWLAILPPEQLAAAHLGHLDGAAGRQVDGHIDSVTAEVNGWGTDAGPSGARPNRMIAVIGSFHDTPLAWLQSGQGMQRVLLTADAAGLTTSMLSQIVRAVPTRKQLRTLIGGGVWPQAVVSLECPAQSPIPQSGSADAPHNVVHRPVSH